MLLDVDIDPRVEPLLRGVGFWVRRADRVKVDIHDDVAILRWARRYGYILLSHDRHSDLPTRLVWRPEIALRGGQVIELRSDEHRNPYTTVGRLLASRVKWRAWFDEHVHGVVYVQERGITPRTQQELGRMAPNILPLTDQGGPREARQPAARRTRKKKAPPEAQFGFPEPPG